MKRTIAITLFVALGATACGGDTAEVDSAIDEATTGAIEEAEDATGTTLAEDTAESVAKLQTSLDVLAAEMADVEAPVALETAWAELQARAVDAAISTQLETEFDPAALDRAVEAFEDELEASELSPALEQAWAEFRAAIDALMASI